MNKLLKFVDNGRKWYYNIQRGYINLLKHMGRTKYLNYGDGFKLLEFEIINMFP